MTAQTALRFAIDRQNKTPLFEQLCAAIRNQAHAGILQQGARLPATRVLAEELGISRSTVVTAYEQLVAEGYLQGHRGAGYRLCAIGSIELAADKIPPNQSVAVTQQTLKPLAPSEPDMRLFPYRPWAKTVARICRTDPSTMLTGADRFGHRPLRQAIAEHVREWRGLEASTEQIIITAGATDALTLCFRSLIRDGQTVGIEDPGYQPIARLLASHGIGTVPLAVDQHGASLPTAQRPPTAVVLTPSHQYPLGGVMSPQRRNQYLTWAKDNDGWIIEDDYDSEFRYAGRPIPAMAGFDQLNHSLYIGSFAKVFSKALRLGYLIVPHSLIEPMRQTMDNFGLKAGLMPQPALAEFMREGHFYRHLRRVRKLYNERRSYLVDRLNSDFNMFGSVQDHPAGMQLVFHLKPKIADTDVAQRAVEMGLKLETLSAATQQQHYNGLILGFSGHTVEEMQQSMDSLQQLLTEVASKA